MALTIQYRGTNNSSSVCDASCFTVANYPGFRSNTTVSVNTPRGVLGGSVAAISSGSDYTVFPGNTTLTPIGLFINDAAGKAFENSPAVASNKIAVIRGKASVEVDVYETQVVAGGAMPWAVGKSVYCSAQGLLTTEQVNSTREIGVITKIPSLANPTLGIDMVL